MSVVAQEAASTASTASTASAASVDSLQKKYDGLQEELRALAIETQRIGVEYVNATTGDQAYLLADQYEEKIVEGNEVADRWMVVGEQLYYAKLDAKVQSGDSDKIDDDLTLFVTKIMNKYYDKGQYGKAYEMCDKLFKDNPENKYAEIFLARSGMLTNHFGTRISDLLLANQEFFIEEETVTDTEKILRQTLFYLNEVFKEELKLREQEAKADDLPRVEFETNLGNFTIELFENEAPNTVANFISLTEAKHFDDLLFHTVIHQTAAETGKFEDGFIPRQIGYTIPDEHDKPEHRKIFAGSVAMYRDRPNSADSRFFVALAPLPNLNGTQTVFGRVIEGMDTVYRLNKTYKIEEEEQIKIVDAVADRVISAKVLRKRDHEYLPKKVAPK